MDKDSAVVSATTNDIVASLFLIYPDQEAVFTLMETKIRAMRKDPELAQIFEDAINDPDNSTEDSPVCTDFQRLG